MTRRIFATIVTVWSISFAATPTQLTVAIMDFAGRNVDAQEAAAMADRFRSELSGTGSFSVMERAQMEMVLKEQAFQQTGCVDASCAVEAGQLIAVQKIVTGSVAKVGGMYSVTCKMIDVATGKIDKDISEDCDCPIERVMVETLARLAARLAGKEVTAGAGGISVQRGDASLFVKTDPDGATIYIDGRMMDGRTPRTLENLTGGRHEVRASRSDLVATTVVTLEPKKIARINLMLRVQATVLKIMSDPS